MSWPTGEMTAAVMSGPEDVRLERRSIPPELPGHVLVRVAYVGVCGTDVDLFRGTSYYLREGLQRYPFVFGHEYSGAIVAVGAGVRGLVEGDRVVGHGFIHCDSCPQCHAGRRNLCERRSEMGVWGEYPGAASDLVRVPAKILTKVPTGLTLLDATLAEPTVTVMQGLERTRVGLGDRVAVIGTGTLGLMAVQLAAARGAVVEAVGVEAEGRELAKALGADRTLAPEEVEQERYSVVIEASGVASAAASVPLLLTPGGRAAMIGVCHVSPREFPMVEVTLKDVELHGVLHGINQYEKTLDLFARHVVDPGALIDGVVDKTDAGTVLERLAAGERRPRPKTMLRFAGEEEQS